MAERAGNVFNTFTFRGWAEEKKKEADAEEARKNREKQLKQLRDRLKREKAKKANGGGGGDFDIDALIEAIRNAEAADAAENAAYSRSVPNDRDMFVELGGYNSGFQNGRSVSAPPFAFQYNRYVTNI